MRVLLVDNHVLFREGLSSLLQNQPEIEAVDGVGTLREAVAKALEHKPDIVMIDIDMYTEEGLNTIRSILTHRPETKIIVLSNNDPDHLFINALKCGAKGYLLKNTKFEIILCSIKAVERGEAALSRKMTRRLVDEFARQDDGDGPAFSSIDKLTAREFEIFGHLASGASNREIADQLYISENTVKIHVHNILDKLNLRNRREVAKFAHFQGLEFSTLLNSVE